MRFNPDIHHRQSIRLPHYDYSQAGMYFITICTHERLPIFGEIVDGEMILSSAGMLVEKCWRDLPNHYLNIKLDEFVIMPNHFHGIVKIVGAIHESPFVESPSFESPSHASPKQQMDSSGLDIDIRMIHARAIRESPLQRRKMVLSKMIGRFKMVSAKQINQLRNNSGIPVWQRNYYEHIIRNDDAYNKITEYILNNPSKWQEDKYHP